MKSTSFDPAKLVLSSAIFLGIILRFAPTLMAGFPLNDGGMFLSMIRDLHISGYMLPATTSYNLSNIPYAYPPFGFYLVRLLTDIAFNDIFWLRFIPALVSTIAIVGLYLLARDLTDSREIGAWTALIYALTPRSFAWLIMGGGLTRSLGYGFFLFTSWSVYRLFREGSRTWLVPSVMFAALTSLSHPESSLHAAAFCILLWLFYGRTRRSTLHAFIVGAGTLLFSAPWWGSVMMYHRLAPFLSVLNTGMHGASLFGRFWLAIFPNDSMLPIQAILFLAAIGWGIFNRKYFYLVWIILPCLVEPRSGIYVVLFPLCILTAMLLLDISRYLLHKKGNVGNDRSRSIHWLLPVLVLYLFVEAYLFGFRLVNISLTLADRSEMTWVRENTLTDGRFILLTGNTAPEQDAFQEWFPALTERKSLTTFQGTEWTLGPRFFTNFRALVNLQACASADCVASWIKENKITFDYLLVRKKNVPPELINSLKSDVQFESLREDDNVILLTPK